MAAFHHCLVSGVVELMKQEYWGHYRSFPHLMDADEDLVDEVTGIMMHFLLGRPYPEPSYLRH